MLSVDSDLLAEGSSTGVRAAVEAEESMVYRKSRSERKRKREKRNRQRKGLFITTLPSTARAVCHTANLILNLLLAISCDHAKTFRTCLVFPAKFDLLLARRWV